MSDGGRLLLFLAVSGVYDATMNVIYTMNLKNHE
jgi:hypothetical protein